MRIFALASLLFILNISCLQMQAQQSPSHEKLKDELELLMEKIRNDFAINPPVDKIKVHLKTYNEANGSFFDIDYANKQRTKWHPLQHIDRLYDFAFAYTNCDNEYYGNDELYNKIIKGLEYWYNCNPKCDNWWYNQIASPQSMGVLLIQMRAGKKHIPAELEEKILDRIRKDGGQPEKWTGANRTDIALHWIYRACLTANINDLIFALDNVYSPIVYTTAEGFQYDNSYFQHGRQLYIGGYGDEILKGATQIAKYTHGTRFAMPNEKIDILSKFMRETYYPTMRGKYMSFDVLGRSISRQNILDKSATKLFAKRMIELDPEYADEFRDIIMRLEGEADASYAITPKHTHYYIGDYTLHQRPKYIFDVRLASKRTMRCEYGNGENLKTYFLTDGCTNIVRKGDEYLDIFPVWNWTRIPGTTSPQISPIPMAPSDWQTPGFTTFAGGVSDGLYGVTAYSYCDIIPQVNTCANKAWFFFDDEIVCLGSGINSTAKADVNTTVNQTLTSPDKKVIITDSKGTRTLDQDSIVDFSSKWILHDDIAYIFPEGGNIFVSQKEQSGSWYDINRSESKDEVTKDVFTLGINHKTNPIDADYAYIVVPDQNSPKNVNKYLSKKNIEICANTPDMQVVKNNNLGIYGIVFYKAGKYADKNIAISADKPCILMLNIKNRISKLYIADPLQERKIITIRVRLHKKAKNTKTIVCNLTDSDIYAGKTKVFEL